MFMNKKFLQRAKYVPITVKTVFRGCVIFMTASQRGVVRLGTNLVNSYKLIWMMLCSQKPQVKKNRTSCNLDHASKSHEIPEQRITILCGDTLRSRSPAEYVLDDHVIWANDSLEILNPKLKEDLKSIG